MARSTRPSIALRTSRLDQKPAGARPKIIAAPNFTNSPRPALEAARNRKIRMEETHHRRHSRSWKPPVKERLDAERPADPPARHLSPHPSWKPNSTTNSRFHFDQHVAKLIHSGRLAPRSTSGPRPSLNSAGARSHQRRMSRSPRRPSSSKLSSRTLNKLWLRHPAAKAPGFTVARHHHLSPSASAPIPPSPAT